MGTFKNGNSQIEQRVHERMRTNLYSRFYYDEQVHPGVVTNISGNGLCMKTREYLSISMKFHVLIPLIEEVIKVPAEVTRLIMINDLYDGFAAKILSPPHNYLAFIKSLKSEASFQTLR